MPKLLMVWSFKTIRWLLCVVGALALVLAAMVAMPLTRPPELASISASRPGIDVSALPAVERFQARDGTMLGLFAETIGMIQLAQPEIGKWRVQDFVYLGSFANVNSVFMMRKDSAIKSLDEMRHTQIPLLLMHELVRWDPQFEWTHFFYHSNQWVAIAGRHLMDELLLASDPIEFAIATNFVFETGFTNLQFVGLSALAHRVGDKMF